MGLLHTRRGLGLGLEGRGRWFGGEVGGRRHRLWADTPPPLLLDAVSMGAIQAHMRTLFAAAPHTAAAEEAAELPALAFRTVRTQTQAQPPEQPCAASARP